MPEPREHLRFAHEPFRRRSADLEQHFDRDGVTGPNIAGAEHRAHPPFARRAFDFEAVDDPVARLHCASIGGRPANRFLQSVDTPGSVRAQPRARGRSRANPLPPSMIVQRRSSPSSSRDSSSDHPRRARSIMNSTGSTMFTGSRRVPACARAQRQQDLRVGGSSAFRARVRCRRS